MKSNQAALVALAAASLAMSGCIKVGSGSSSDTTAEGGSAPAASAAETPTTEAQSFETPTTEAQPVETAATEAQVPTTAATTAPATAAALTYDADGPAVCIDKAIEHLGPDAMVYEISSHFEWDEPDVAEGELWLCEAYYQNPDNPLKLVAVKMDTDTQEFGEPEEVELTVTGNAADFDLNDYVIPASSIKTDGIKPATEEQDGRLADVYSTWHWDRVSLVSPGAFTDVHVFDLRVEGRLAKNDLESNGYGYIPIDGSSKLVTDHILPS